MIQLYFHHTPNPMKVALALEEFGLDYEAVPIDIFKGEQHQSGFVAINPNAKVPAIVDGGTPVFDSNAILLYLAQKHGRFIADDEQERAATLSWLFFIATGLSPFSGQATHFLLHAPEPIPYATSRYVKEVERHYRVLDGHLAGHPYLAGAAYSVADMALWGWARLAYLILGEDALDAFPSVKRLVDEIAARPAAQRAEALAGKYKMKTVVDEETRRAIFASHGE